MSSYLAQQSFSPPKSRDWESILNNWSAPPSTTEQEKCERAELAIRKAIAASHILANRTIRVFPQGSYRNRTNVRQDSDVDICVLCLDTFFYDLPNGVRPVDFGLTSPATYSYPTFKSEVENALVDYFGPDKVKRGNKAFDVHANTYRLDADVVPCFLHRRYRGDGSCLEGTEFISDNGNRIINWPEQHYTSGVNKNDATGRRFKGMVRSLKRLRNEMLGNGIAAAEPIPSFLIESLVWNVPNNGFQHGQYLQDMRFVLAHLWNNTRLDDGCSEWGEINELKYLFRVSQPWTRAHANVFLQAAWDYMGFE